MMGERERRERRGGERDRAKWSCADGKGVVVMISELVM